MQPGSQYVFEMREDLYLSTDATFRTSYGIDKHASDSRLEICKRDFRNMHGVLRTPYGVLTCLFSGPLPPGLFGHPSLKHCNRVGVRSISSTAPAGLLVNIVKLLKLISTQWST